MKSPSKLPLRYTYALFKSTVILILTMSVNLHLYSQEDLQIDEHQESFAVSSNSADNIYWEPMPRYGIFGGYGLNLHSVSFTSLSGFPKPATPMLSPLGMGFSGGLEYHFPMDILYPLSFLDSAYFIPRLQVEQLNGEFTSDEPTKFIDGTTPVNGIISHKYTASLMSISVVPGIEFQMYDNFYGAVGIHLGYLIQKKIDQSHSISSPSNVFFNNGRQSWAQRTGDIDASGIRLGLDFAARYPLRFGFKDRWRFIPELRLHVPITSTDTDWRLYTVRLGATLALEDLRPKPTRYDTTLFKDTVERKIKRLPQNNVVFLSADTTTSKREDDNFVYKSTRIRRHFESQVGFIPPAVSLDVKSFTADGKAFTNLKFSVTRMFAMLPLLNYVFFENGSAELPNRYSIIKPDQVQNYHMTNLISATALTAHYDLLNIIARRMQDNPTSTINLVGCTSGELEKGGMALATSRAEAIKNYMTSTWGIASERISLVSRLKPEHASSNGDPDGQAENRRVEIQSETDQLLEPIFVQDSVVKYLDDSLIVFQPSVQNNNRVASWRFEVYSSGVLKETQAGQGQVPLNLTVNKQKLFNSKNPNGNLSFKLFATTDEGEKIDSRMVEIPISVSAVSTGDESYVDKYQLILFAYRTNRLSDGHKKVVSFIRSRLKPGARVSITGVTDRLGDAQFNHDLSERRAESVANTLAFPGQKHQGMGENDSVFPNELPEGRFLSRTVFIVATNK